MKKRNKNSFRRHIMYLMGFIIATSIAIPSYIQSSFLEDHIRVELVSVFFVLANLITITAIAFFPQVIHKLGNYFSTKLSVILYGAALAGLAAATGPVSATLSLLLYITCSNLLW